MRTIAVLIAMFIAQQFQAQTDSTSVTITVKNLSTNDGNVLFGLYTENNFLKAAPLYHSKSEIKNGTAQVTFTGIPAGTYAVSCFHDLNGNGQMDFEPTGMPKEPYGISNNAINYDGPPQWDEAKFEVGSQPVNLDIKIE